VVASITFNLRELIEMKQAGLIELLMGQFEGRFSTQLGIHLASGRSEEIFKWFLASLLFGTRISEQIATNTYGAFEVENLVRPEQILEAGWDRLVEVLDEGGYARYDYKTATKLLDIMKNLMSEYGGDLNRLHATARDSEDLEKRLAALGKGIGPTTVNIFLREMREIWPKAEPALGELAEAAARDLGLTKNRKPKQALADIKAIWKESKVRGKSFADLEAALVRLALYCRRKKCSPCSLEC